MELSTATLAEVERKREQRAWYFYDWANSAFASTVLTLFLGPYLTAIARAAAGPDGLVHPFGLNIDPRAFWGYCVSLSVIGQVVVLPLVGALADYRRNKREFLGAFAYLGALATMAMFFVQGDLYLLGGGLFLLANISFGAANVISNSFLSELSTPEERDAVSSRGWGFGYLGGGLLLLLNLLFFSNAEKLGFTESFAVRVSLGSAGLWWAAFTLIPLARLKNRGTPQALPPGENIVSVGFHQFLHTLKDLRRYPQTMLYLVAYLIYNDAIQTVIALAGQFGSDELKMPMSKLTVAILMVQFVAFLGATLFGYLAYIYAAVSTHEEFFIMSFLVGMIMGGTQALSRSLFSLMIPAGKEAEYFSVYEISDKGTSWLGPLIFALALQTTGSYRTAILSLVVFFVVGFVLLFRVDVAKAAATARNN
jgi:UMF1 family MFS transporter